MKKFVVFLSLLFLINNFSFVAYSQTLVPPMDGFFEWLKDVSLQGDNNAGKSKEEILEPLQQDGFIFYDLRSADLTRVDSDYLLDLLGKREIKFAESLQSIPPISIPSIPLEVPELEDPTIDLETFEQSEAEVFLSIDERPPVVVFLINVNTVFPLGFNLNDFECFFRSQAMNSTIIQNVCFSHLVYEL